MRTSLSIRNTNILFLLTMVLILTAGSVVQMLDLSLGLIATEVFLILLPTILFLRRGQIPLKEGLRLNPISIQTAVTSLLLGFTTYLFSIFIETVMIQLTGMLPVTLPEGALPTGVFDSILYFIAMAISAPICEEILFRGAIQSAYEERRSLRLTITITALMFAFYHFRLTGLLGLIPVAFILGYVAWRTRSIYASVLVHFGMNATSSVNTLVAIHVNETGLPIISPWMALIGVAATIVLLILIHRFHPAPKPVAPSGLPSEIADKPVSWFGIYWPLLVSGMLYMVVAGMTLVVELSPELRATTEMVYNPPVVEREIESRYQIINRGGEVIGEMECILSPQQDILQMECISQIEAYEVQTESSYFKDIGHSTTWTAVWDASTMGLLDYSFERHDAMGNSLLSEIQDGVLVTEMGESTSAADLDSNSLVEYEWAWRVGTLEAQPGDVRQVEYAYLTRWDEITQKSITTRITEYLKIFSEEAISVPAGDYNARKLDISHQTAWYASDFGEYPTPVQFDDGMVFYSLVE